jgi:transcriptional regulator with GAF, ATPase, and Fis domain
MNDFDHLVLEQVKAGDTPCKVPFAGDVFALLQQLGFGLPAIISYFGIFYQIRRAYYFIENALTGFSPSMHKLREQLWNNIFTYDINWYRQHLWNKMEDFSTLLLGETGTGKGAAAAAIGRSGFIPFDEPQGRFTESFARNFISLNLSQYPATLLESELFGHKKGAFTGAIENHSGIFSLCSPHGSIFLDEIGDISVPVQIKLLQVLQERTFSPVGSHDRLRFRGRVIAATNKPLDSLRKQGEFRDDFYYRLCSDIITVPPLCQRIHEDPRELTELVASIVLRLIGAANQDLVHLVCEIIGKELGNDYPWPGNVRELEQAVRRIILTRHYRGEIGEAAPALRAHLAEGGDAGNKDAKTLLAEHCCRLFAQHRSYEEVARRTRLDRRTVKKYIEMATDGAQKSHTVS